MSYDLRIFFPHDVFPREEWNRVLSLFETEECEEGPEYSSTEGEWVAFAKPRSAWKPEEGDAYSIVDSTTGATFWLPSWILHLSLNRLSPKTWINSDCTPTGSNWVVTMYVSGGDAEAQWTLFAIPYYALGFIEGITVHDCQWHSDENMYSFQDPEKWAEFASIAVRRRASTQSLKAAGLLDNAGRILF